MKNPASLLLLILLNFGSLFGFAQSRWMRTYHDELNTPMLFISNSYDYGCFISGRYKPNYPRYNWLIKTNINGEILWEKTLGDGINTILVLEMAQNPVGNLFLSGEIFVADDYGDPFILKLNACGEKEWCQIFNSSNHMDFAESVCITEDSGCALILNMTGEDYVKDRICLAKFSAAGDLEWKQCYNSPDSLLGNEDSENLILTPDNGYLITGWCYYADPTGTFNMIHPYYIKCDSLGNFQWETIAEKETGFIGGQGWQTVTDPSRAFFYSSISRYHIDSLNSGDSPALLKMNMQGEIIDIYELAEPGEVGKLWDAKFLNDSLLAASASWGDPDINSPMAVIIDTLGNIKKQSFLLDNRYMSYVRPTYDMKIFFYTEDFDPQTEDFSVYLFKLNQNLEDDTIYTQPFTYDSLCPYHIVSDTIVPDDCGLIVGVEEPGSGEAGKHEGMEAGGQGGMEIWPNPAKEVLSVKCLGLSAGIVYELVIYDIFGRPAISPTPIIPPSGEIRGGWSQQINIESLPPGVYIAILKNGPDIIDSQKFVVAR